MERRSGASGQSGWDAAGGGRLPSRSRGARAPRVVSNGRRKAGAWAGRPKGRISRSRTGVSTGSRWSSTPGRRGSSSTTSSAELYGGGLSGGGEFGFEGLDAPLSLALEWRDLQLGMLPLELPEGAFGAVNGLLIAAGTMARPTAEVELDWTPADPASPVPPLAAAGSLEDGVLRLVTREVATELGTAIARATVPLGGLPLPEWLWPEAPDEAIRVVADGHNLRSEPLLALLGVEPLPVSATAELTLDAEWRPGSPEGTRVYAELSGFRMQTAAGVVEAQGPLEFRIDSRRVRLEPAVLTGPQTRIEVSGEADLASRRIDGTLDAVVAPTIARLIPYPVQIYQPIQLSATATGTLDAPRAMIKVDHSGGALVMRDPPLQIQDLKLSAEIVDGRLWINDGRAEVNQGRIELGGGWDAGSGQGIVAEIDNVVVFVEGILSQWSGTVAIEPEPGRLAKITGELNLVAGLWDQDVSLGGALFGPSSLDPAGDDPLYDIVLDLDVRGRGIVRVENNLGRFDARWDVLRVTGNAAEPEIRGKISIAPGGRLSLAGQRVTVRRGSLVFTGDPAVDPVMEIVPDSDIAAFGGGDTDRHHEHRHPGARERAGRRARVRERDPAAGRDLGRGREGLVAAAHVRPAAEPQHRPVLRHQHHRCPGPDLDVPAVEPARPQGVGAPGLPEDAHRGGRRQPRPAVPVGRLVAVRGPAHHPQAQARGRLADRQTAAEKGDRLPPRPTVRPVPDLCRQGPDGARAGGGGLPGGNRHRACRGVERRLDDGLRVRPRAEAGGGLQGRRSAAADSRGGHRHVPAAAPRAGRVPKHGERARSSLRRRRVSGICGRGRAAGRGGGGGDPPRRRHRAQRSGGGRGASGAQPGGAAAARVADRARHASGERCPGETRGRARPRRSRLPGRGLRIGDQGRARRETVGNPDRGRSRGARRGAPSWW